MVKWKWKVLFLLLIPTLLVGVVALPVCSHYVWSPLSQLPSAHDVQHHEGNIPILAEVNSFLTKQVTIQQEADSHDSLHKIFIYMADSSCNDLPVLSTTIDRYNLTHTEDIIPVYMLEKSKIDMYICASTQHSENNPLIVYILRTVEEILSFDGHLHKWDYHKNLPVGKGGQWICTNITKVIRERDYYSIRFAHFSDVTVTYDLNITINTVNIDAINATLVGHFEADDDQDQQASETISFGTEKLCLFADIDDSAIPFTHNYTTLETHLKPRYGAALGITVSMTVLLFLLALSVELLICFIFKRSTSMLSMSQV